MKQHTHNNQNRPTVTEEAINQRVTKAVEDAVAKTWAEANKKAGEAAQLYEQETRRIMQDATASVAEMETHIEKMKEHNTKVQTHLIIGICFIVLAWMVTTMILI